MTPISNSNPVLVIEDDEPKMRAVLSLLSELAIDHTMIVSASSVASALECISKNSISFAIIDMSLPAFDFARDVSGGGQPQGTGGRDILRFLEDEQPCAKAVVLTQYHEFDLGRAFTAPQKLDRLVLQMKTDFPSILIDVLSYTGQRGEWRESLKNILLSSGAT